MDTPNGILTPGQVCDLLRVSPSTLQKMVAKRTITATGGPGSVRFSQAEAERLLGELDGHGGCRCEGDCECHAFSAGWA